MSPFPVAGLWDMRHQPWRWVALGEPTKKCWGLIGWKPILETKKKHFHVTTSMMSMFVMHPASVNPKTVHTAHGTSPQDTRETKPRHCFRQLLAVCLNRGDQSTGCSCSQVSPLYFTCDDDLPLCLSPPPNKLMQRQTKSSKLPMVTWLILDLLLLGAKESGHRNALGII